MPSTAQAGAPLPPPNAISDLTEQARRLAAALGQPPPGSPPVTFGQRMGVGSDVGVGADEEPESFFDRERRWRGRFSILEGKKRTGEPLTLEEQREYNRLRTDIWNAIDQRSKAPGGPPLSTDDQQWFQIIGQAQPYNVTPERQPTQLGVVLDPQGRPIENRYEAPSGQIVAGPTEREENPKRNVQFIPVAGRGTIEYNLDTGESRLVPGTEPVEDATSKKNLQFIAVPGVGTVEYNIDSGTSRLVPGTTPVKDPTKPNIQLIAVPGRGTFRYDMDTGESTFVNGTDPVKDAKSGIQLIAVPGRGTYRYDIETGEGGYIPGTEPVTDPKTNLQLIPVAGKGTLRYNIETGESSIIPGTEPDKERKGPIEIAGKFFNREAYEKEGKYVEENIPGLSRRNVTTFQGKNGLYEYDKDSGQVRRVFQEEERPEIKPLGQGYFMVPRGMPVRMLVKNDSPSGDPWYVEERQNGQRRVVDSGAAWELANYLGQENTIVDPRTFQDFYRGVQSGQTYRPSYEPSPWEEEDQQQPWAGYGGTSFGYMDNAYGWGQDVGSGADAPGYTATSNPNLIDVQGYGQMDWDSAKQFGINRPTPAAAPAATPSAPASSLGTPTKTGGTGLGLGTPTTRRALPAPRQQLALPAPQGATAAAPRAMPAGLSQNRISDARLAELVARGRNVAGVRGAAAPMTAEQQAQQRQSPYDANGNLNYQALGMEVYGDPTAKQKYIDQYVNENRGRFQSQVSRGLMTQEQMDQAIANETAAAEKQAAKMPGLMAAGLPIFQGKRSREDIAAGQWNPQNPQQWVEDQDIWTPDGRRLRRYTGSDGQSYLAPVVASGGYVMNKAGQVVADPRTYDQNGRLVEGASDYFGGAPQQKTYRSARTGEIYSVPHYAGPSRYEDELIGGFGYREPYKVWNGGAWVDEGQINRSPTWAGGQMSSGQIYGSTPNMPGYQAPAPEIPWGPSNPEYANVAAKYNANAIAYEDMQARMAQQKAAEQQARMNQYWSSPEGQSSLAQMTPEEQQARRLQAGLGQDVGSGMDTPLGGLNDWSPQPTTWSGVGDFSGDFVSHAGARKPWTLTGAGQEGPARKEDLELSYPYQLGVGQASGFDEGWDPLIERIAQDIIDNPEALREMLDFRDTDPENLNELHRQGVRPPTYDQYRSEGARATGEHRLTPDATWDAVYEHSNRGEGSGPRFILQDVPQVLRQGAQAIPRLVQDAASRVNGGVIGPWDFMPGGPQQYLRMAVPEVFPDYWEQERSGEGQDVGSGADPSFGSGQAFGVGAEVPPVPPESVVGTGHKFGDEVSMEGVHKGTDLQAVQGTPALAPVTGTVVDVKYEEAGLGLQVLVQSAEDGTVHKLSHLLDAFVEPGDEVEAGEEIAVVGSSGAGSTGPHLDYRIMSPDQSQYFNPEPSLGPLAQMPRADKGGPMPGMPMPGMPMGGGQDMPWEVGVGADEDGWEYYGNGQWYNVNSGEEYYDDQWDGGGTVNAASFDDGSSGFDYNGVYNDYWSQYGDQYDPSASQYQYQQPYDYGSTYNDYYNQYGSQLDPSGSQYGYNPYSGFSNAASNYLNNNYQNPTTSGGGGRSTTGGGSPQTGYDIIRDPNAPGPGANGSPNPNFPGDPRPQQSSRTLSGGGSSGGGITSEERGQYQAELDRQYQLARDKFDEERRQYGESADLKRREMELDNDYRTAQVQLGYAELAHKEGYDTAQIYLAIERNQLDKQNMENQFQYQQDRLDLDRLIHGDSMELQQMQMAIDTDMNERRLAMDEQRWGLEQERLQFEMENSKARLAMDWQTHQDETAYRQQDLQLRAQLAQMQMASEQARIGLDTQRLAVEQQRAALDAALGYAKIGQDDRRLAAEEQWNNARIALETSQLESENAWRQIQADVALRNLDNDIIRTQIDQDRLGLDTRKTDAEIANDAQRLELERQRLQQEKEQAELNRQTQIDISGTFEQKRQLQLMDSALKNPWMQQLLGMAPGALEPGGPGWSQLFGGNAIGGTTGQIGQAMGGTPTAQTTGATGGTANPQNLPSFEEYANQTVFQRAANRVKGEFAGTPWEQQAQDLREYWMNNGGPTTAPDVTQLQMAAGGPRAQINASQIANTLGQSTEEYFGNQTKNWQQGAASQVEQKA